VHSKTEITKQPAPRLLLMTSRVAPVICLRRPPSTRQRDATTAHFPPNPHTNRLHPFCSAESSLLHVALSVLVLPWTSATSLGQRERHLQRHQQRRKRYDALSCTLVLIFITSKVGIMQLYSATTLASKLAGRLTHDFAAKKSQKPSFQADCRRIRL
jgi:hypothetical protein